MTKKKKVILIVSLVLFVVLAVGIIVPVIVLPVTYSIDKSLVKKNPDYSVTIVKDQKYTTLTKNYASDDDEFKIIGFTDLHLDMHKTDGGDNTINMMIRNIVNEKPDLVVFTGDIVTGYLNKRRTKQFCKLMEDLGVYWVLALGNHEGDYKLTLSRKDQIKLMSSYKHCLIDSSTKYTKDGTKVWGNGNCAINILNKDGKIAQTLYMIDSGNTLSSSDLEKYKDTVYPADAKADYLVDGTPEHRYHYDYIKQSQITWYKETVDDINAINGSPVKSSVFIHIPLPEMEEAWMSITGERYRVFDEYHQKTYDYSATSGNRLLMGERREIVCHAGYNSGMFDACLEKGAQSIFFGHDHINNCVVEYKGIMIGYIQPGSYSGYNTLSCKTADGVSVEDHLICGYSVLKYAKDGTLTLEEKQNCDLYPALDAKLREQLRKK